MSMGSTINTELIKKLY